MRDYEDSLDELEEDLEYINDNGKLKEQLGID